MSPPSPSEPGEFGDLPARYIEPALYPLGPGRWAVLLITEQYETYAGGGATFAHADVVELPEQSASLTPDQAVFGEVPFGCSKLVRACFWERDYRTKRHCHDEWWGAATLRIQRAADSGTYDWQLLWKETEWPPGNSKHRKTSWTSASLRASEDADTREQRLHTLPFCGGGPMEWLLAEIPLR